MRSRVLVVTVGGSHQPVVTAIRESGAEYVVFLCTDRDPVTGRPGSRVEVEGNGLCIRAAPADPAPSLPNIPTQVGLRAGQFELRMVPADDLEAAFRVARDALARVRASAPGAEVLADYSGGTKTMTAALVLAALESDEVGLRFVTGARGNLVRVDEGTQAQVPAAVEGVRLGRAMRVCLGSWRSFAYAEAEAGLRSLQPPADARLRAELLRARALSAAFAAWDRFEHRVAYETLRSYAAVFGNVLAPYLRGGRHLAGERSGKHDGLAAWDLWLNALRRAAAGRYDDAVARAYRVIEWTAQWLLESRAGLRTADLPAEAAAAVGISAGRDGRYQAGLWSAWQLVERRVGGGAGQFFSAEAETMRDHLRRRNESILAHGFVPVAEQDWAAMRAWLEATFEPMLRAELAATGVRDPFPQLPTEYPVAGAK